MAFTPNKQERRWLGRVTAWVIGNRLRALLRAIALLVFLYVGFTLQFFDGLFGTDVVPAPIARFLSGRPEAVSVRARPLVGPTTAGARGVCVKTNFDYEACRRDAERGVWLMAEVTVTPDAKLEDRITVECDVTSDDNTIEERFRYTFQAEYHGDGALAPGVHYTHVIGVTNYRAAVDRFTRLNPPTSLADNFEVAPTKGRVACKVTQAW